MSNLDVIKTSLLNGDINPNTLLRRGITENNVDMVNLSLYSGAIVTPELYELSHKHSSLNIFELVQSFTFVDFSSDIYFYLDNKDFVGLHNFIISRRTFFGCKIPYVQNIIQKYPSLDLFSTVKTLIEYCYRPTAIDYNVASELSSTFTSLNHLAKLIKGSMKHFRYPTLYLI